MKNLSRWFVLSSHFALVATAAQATIQELEPNDSIAQAQVLAIKPPFSEAVVGTLAPGDVDFYQFEMLAGTLYAVNLFDYTPLIEDTDPILALFDASGTMIEFDDNSGPDALPVLFGVVPSTGTYFVAASGVGDNGFVGDHLQDFAYKLVLNCCLPAPGALPLLGALMLINRRRRRSAA